MNELKLSFINLDKEATVGVDPCYQLAEVWHMSSVNSTWLCDSGSQGDIDLVKLQWSLCTEHYGEEFLHIALHPRVYFRQELYVCFIDSRWKFCDPAYPFFFRQFPVFIKQIKNQA